MVFLLGSRAIRGITRQPQIERTGTRSAMDPHENRKDSGPAGVPDNNAESGPQRETNPIKRFLKILGPGLVTGASDDDPSGISTYAMAGASLGYATLWIALVTFPLMAAVQFICAKIGLVSGRGITEVIRQHYSRFLLYPVV